MIIHLVLTVLIGWLVASYIAGAFILLGSKEQAIKDHDISDKFYIWALSPLVVLVWLWNKVVHHD
jgi:RsiW-degrading membrane proteinase PrsW (M82 family)